MQFDLVEKLSNPERVEQRRGENSTTQQSAPGQPIGSHGGKGDGDDDKPEELTGFEQVLKRVDGWLGDNA
ncbi:hypothetical protein D9M71_820210 [compost metagenome]